MYLQSARIEESKAALDWREQWSLLLHFHDRSANIWSNLFSYLADFIFVLYGTQAIFLMYSLIIAGIWIWSSYLSARKYPAWKPLTCITVRRANLAKVTALPQLPEVLLFTGSGSTLVCIGSDFQPTFLQEPDCRDLFVRPARLLAREADQWYQRSLIVQEPILAWDAFGLWQVRECRQQASETFECVFVVSEIWIVDGTILCMLITVKSAWS